MSPSVLILRAVLLRIALASPFANASNTLYVNKNGVSGLGCTIDFPCAAVQQAVDLAKEGDTIMIGKGRYVENILIKTAYLTLDGADKAHIVSAGGLDGATGNAGNSLDAIVEIKAPGITIRRLNLTHPSGKATKRDAAVFAWPGSDGLVVTECKIQRNRDDRTDEPTTPGSRGVFILLSPGSAVTNNVFRGNYQDHIHLPTGDTLVADNDIRGASRAGISVMDPDIFDNFASKNNIIRDNKIVDSLDDGVHIQGDFASITGNKIKRNSGRGIYLCGSAGSECYPPGANAVSEGNFVSGNIIKNNAQEAVLDFGGGNVVEQD